MQRTATVERKTLETQIKVTFNLDGTGKSHVQTGIAFMDHMLELFAKHGLFDLEVNAVGDLHIDGHHTMEDLGIVMGQSLAQALGDKSGIKRYGHTLLPMDEALALVALDCSGRAYLEWDVKPPATYIKDLDTQLFCEFFRALSMHSGLNLHIQLMKAGEVHHAFEAIFKGFAKALDQATCIDPRIVGVLSTKGSL